MIGMKIIHIGSVPAMRKVLAAEGTLVQGNQLTGSGSGGGLLSYHKHCHQL